MWRRYVLRFILNKPIVPSLNSSFLPTQNQIALNSDLIGERPSSTGSLSARRRQIGKRGCLKVFTEGPTQSYHLSNASNSNLGHQSTRSSACTPCSGLGRLVGEKLHAVSASIVSSVGPSVLTDGNNIIVRRLANVATAAACMLSSAAAVCCSSNFPYIDVEEDNICESSTASSSGLISKFKSSVSVSTVAPSSFQLKQRVITTPGYRGDPDKEDVSFNDRTRTTENLPACMSRENLNKVKKEHFEKLTEEDGVSARRRKRVTWAVGVQVHSIPARGFVEYNNSSSSSNSATNNSNRGTMAILNQMRSSRSGGDETNTISSTFDRNSTFDMNHTESKLLFPFNNNSFQSVNNNLSKNSENLLFPGVSSHFHFPAVANSPRGSASSGMNSPGFAHDTTGDPVFFGIAGQCGSCGRTTCLGCDNGKTKSGYYMNGKHSGGLRSFSSTGYTTAVVGSSQVQEQQQQQQYPSVPIHFQSFEGIKREVVHEDNNKPFIDNIIRAEQNIFSTCDGHFFSDHNTTDKNENYENKTRAHSISDSSSRFVLDSKDIQPKLNSNLDSLKGVSSMTDSGHLILESHNADQADIIRGLLSTEKQLSVNNSFFQDIVAENTKSECIVSQNSSAGEYFKGDYVGRYSNSSNQNCYNNDRAHHLSIHPHESSIINKHLLTEEYQHSTSDNSMSISAISHKQSFNSSQLLISSTSTNTPTRSQGIPSLAILLKQSSLPVSSSSSTALNIGVSSHLLNGLKGHLTVPTTSSSVSTTDTYFPCMVGGGSSQQNATDTLANCNVGGDHSASFLPPNFSGSQQGSTAVSRPPSSSVSTLSSTSSNLQQQQHLIAELCNNKNINNNNQSHYNSRGAATPVSAISSAMESINNKLGANYHNSSHTPPHLGAPISASSSSSLFVSLNSSSKDISSKILIEGYNDMQEDSSSPQTHDDGVGNVSTPSFAMVINGRSRGASISSSSNSPVFSRSPAVRPSSSLLNFLMSSNNHLTASLNTTKSTASATLGHSNGMTKAIASTMAPHHSVSGASNASENSTNTSGINTPTNNVMNGGGMHQNLPGWLLAESPPRKKRQNLEFHWA